MIAGALVVLASTLLVTVFEKDEPASAAPVPSEAEAD
jgi:hypothetical protein